MGTESARPFLAARDFELSKRFYVALGFEKVLDGDVAVFSVGCSGFILSRFQEIENFMMQLRPSGCSELQATLDIHSRTVIV